VVSGDGPLRDMLVLPGGVVLTWGQGVLETASAFETLKGVRRSNGASSSPRLDARLDALRDAAREVLSSAPGTTEPTWAAGVPVFAMTDPVTAKEAAQMIGCSDSYLRRQCRRGRFETADRPDGRTWLIERADVLAWVSDGKAS
jgi:ERCC4-type nuclease